MRHGNVVAQSRAMCYTHTSLLVLKISAVHRVDVKSIWKQRMRKTHFKAFSLLMTVTMEVNQNNQHLILKQSLLLSGIFFKVMLNNGTMMNDWMSMLILNLKIYIVYKQKNQYSCCCGNNLNIQVCKMCMLLAIMTIHGIICCILKL